MMPVPAVVLTDTVAVIAAVGSLLSGIGMVGTVGALYFLLRQARAAEAAGATAAYQSIVAMGNTINDTLFAYPDLIGAMYDHDASAEDGGSGFNLSAERSANPQLLVTALRVLDYFELILVTLPALPRGVQKEWEQYIGDQLQHSRYLRRIVLETGWYIQALQEAARAAVDPDRPADLS
jgi:hypothetical protein